MLTRFCRDSARFRYPQGASTGDVHQEGGKLPQVRRLLSKRVLAVPTMGEISIRGVGLHSCGRTIYIRRGRRVGQTTIFF